MTLAFSPHHRLPILLAAACGWLWAWLGSFLSAATFDGLAEAAIPAGLIIGPAIYLLSRRYYRGSIRTLFGLAFFTTVIAVALFGLSVGLLDAFRDLPGRHPAEVILQPVMGFLWGLFLVPICWGLFPLAFATHALFRHLELRTHTTS